ncbi:MAG: DUF1501 domain-containing protein [Planctomycetes bacterium]|nr:DUF1501 domain-containing protein [Planctomycetota bacterium]
MLRILGSPRRLCDGLTRRDLLLAGGLGAFGLGLDTFFRLEQAQAGSPSPPTPLPPGARGEKERRDRSFGRAKNVILLYLFGGPSHLEMLDMKPAAAPEVRGELKPIRSRLPGCDVCEHLPNLAKVMDRVCVVRSLTHPWNFHGMMWATTGVPESNIPLEETQQHALHQPYLGSVFDHVQRQKHGPKPKGDVPDNVFLPWLLSSKRPAEFYARPHAAYLGGEHDPLCTEFRGQATRSMVRMSFGPAAEIRDPYLGITPDSRFAIAPEAELPADMTLDRLSKRRSLLEQFDRARRTLDGQPAVRSLDRQRARAFSLVNSTKVRAALDLDKEPDRLRERYGMTLFGQGALQARRLVEAGCRFVTVVWDEYGQLNAGWDTHVDHYNRLKKDLLPGLDLAFSALVADLEARGLLDDTLVCVMSEMGRTPKLEGNGRGHWGRAYTNFFAGGGMARGKVVGKTDAIGGVPVERPLSAKDVLATIYHLLGIDPHLTFPDKLNRPVPLVPYGDIVREMLA